MERLYAVIAMFFLTFVEAQGADCIVYSYNRPLLLELFLRSFHENVTDCSSMAVIYLATSPEYEEGYHVLKDEYPDVQFLRQSPTMPQADFQLFTLRAFKEGPSDYVIFAVDDNVVKEKVSLGDMIDLLEKHQAYGFYLRLGTHLTYCYSENREMPLPADLTCVEPNVYAWQFSQGVYEWAYPHTVDMTLYRKYDIEYYVRTLSYTNPNTLEARWASLGCYQPICDYTGLCYRTTKIVNIPLNRVQTTFANRSMDLYSPSELLALFNKGLRIDSTPLYGIKNSAPHIEHYPCFITHA